MLKLLHMQGLLLLLLINLLLHLLMHMLYLLHPIISKSAKCCHWKRIYNVVEALSLLRVGGSYHSQWIKCTKLRRIWITLIIRQSCERSRAETVWCLRWLREWIAWKILPNDLLHCILECFHVSSSCFFQINFIIVLSWRQSISRRRGNGLRIFLMVMTTLTPITSYMVLIVICLMLVITVHAIGLLHIPVIVLT